MSEHPPQPMMTPGRPEFEDLLNNYLDGLLPPAELAAFEHLVQTSPAVRAELEAARAVEEGVRRCFAPPASLGPEAPIARAEPAAPAPLPYRPRWLRWGVGIAAVLLIGFILQQALTPEAGPTWVRGDARICMQSLEEKWEQPKWVCRDDEEFKKFTRDKFGEAWTIKPLDGLKLVGWTYTERLTNNNYANVLMAEYQGRHIALVVDDKKFDRHVSTPADHSLFAHRVGGCSQSHTLVMYELSPLDKPVLLERLQWLPDEPPNPLR